ncbi:nitroreductase family protein [Pseudodesulfovibrio sp.]|uniref:nitroreductase family protein n=1 Tax=unclassified Pseudodesulfovibrio TaxID=2661612 RepID=UPI003AFFB432
MSETAKTGVFDAILKRHSVRTFTDEPVTPAELDALIDAARLAPSSLNSQPWRYKLVTDPEQLAKFGLKEYTRTQTWMAEAGAIIVCCADLTGYVRDSQASAFFFRENKLIEGDSMDGIDDYVARETAAAEAAKFGAAAMNVGIANAFLMLRAVELGLGVCWVGMFNEANVKELLGIDPGLRVVGLIAVGHPAPGQATEHNRKPKEDILLP